MKLALGTVQFGLDYGISNTQGQVDKNQVADILKLAMSLGIDTLDCAGAYGNSEQILGSLSKERPLKQPFNIVSKIPALTDKQCSISELFELSLKSLQRDKIEALLFHHADNLLYHPKKEKLFQQVQALKTHKMVNRIGVSVYSPEQLKSIALMYPIDLVQVPVNIFDQRFISTEVLELCQHKSIKLHVRSLFLQGLLLTEADELPNYFLPYRDKLNAFSELAQYLNCSKLTLALAIVAQELPDYTMKSDIIEKVIVGVCTAKQLNEVATAYQQAKELPLSVQELANLADNRLGLINPSLWNTETNQG